jgi:hypothetical protein
MIEKICGIRVEKIPAPNKVWSFNFINLYGDREITVEIKDFLFLGKREVEGIPEVFAFYPSTTSSEYLNKPVDYIKVYLTIEEARAELNELLWKQEILAQEKIDDIRKGMVRKCQK